MNNQMRVVVVPSMRVARFHGFGPSPEGIAFAAMREWFAGQGITSGRPPVRVFGFNNPNPSAGSPNYGYDFWVELPEGSALAAAVSGPAAALGSASGSAAAGRPELVTFPGGRYGALAHRGTGDTIPGTWKRLVKLIADAGHGHASHQWLEEHYIELGADDEVLSLDCLAPIA